MAIFDPTRRVRIGIVAGEASGDLLGARLIEALRERLPNAEFVGLAGPQMIGAGARTLFDIEKLSVRGFVEVLRRLREILAIRRSLRDYFLAEPPDLFIGVDAPDFNLGLEASLKAAGIPTLHYVSPSIWAWKKKRIFKVKAAADHVLTLFPFEKPLYDAEAIPATYVGHPLADAIPMAADQAAARQALGVDGGGPVVALLPGSRRTEVQLLAAPFIEAARLLLRRAPDARFLVPLATDATRSLFEQTLDRLGARDLPVTLLAGRAHDAMAAADAVLVASGTATLEAALVKRPMVIAYKVPRVTWWISKRLAYLPWVGLPNILAGEFLVPEFLQDAATPEALADALSGLLLDAGVRRRLAGRFAAMHRELRQDAARRAADVVLGMLSRG